MIFWCSSIFLRGQKIQEMLVWLGWIGPTFSDYSDLQINYSFKSWWPRLGNVRIHGSLTLKKDHCRFTRLDTQQAQWWSHAYIFEQTFYRHENPGLMPWFLFHYWPFLDAKIHLGWWDYNLIKSINRRVKKISLTRDTLQRIPQPYFDIIRPPRASFPTSRCVL